MPSPARNTFNAAPRLQPLLREIGLDAESVFTHPDIKIWRSLPERENCTLDADLSDGRHLRLHIKRHHPTRSATTPAEDEATAIRALLIEQIPTVPLVGWGKLTDGRSFLITEDLIGYRDAEKLVREGLPFDQLLQPTADLAAKLHSAGLHHRDLYLCHFFANVADPKDLRLIDAGRVKRLPGWLTRQRWITKDLAQFWYSTTTIPSVTDTHRTTWLKRYTEQRALPSTPTLLRKIQRKSAWIARHDANLRQSQKTRNISLNQPII